MPHVHKTSEQGIFKKEVFWPKVEPSSLPYGFGIGLDRWNRFLRASGTRNIYGAALTYKLGDERDYRVGYARVRSHIHIYV